MKICMIVPDVYVKGGIASVVNGYRTYDFGGQCQISYVESYRDGGKCQKLIKALKGYALFWRELRKNKPDIVHIHSSFGPSFYRKIPFIYMAVWKRVPVVNHIHGAEFDAFYENASHRKKNLVRKVYDKCQMLIALSDEWKEKLKQIVAEEKICVIENYCRIPEDVNVERKKQILFLGEIGKRKGCFDIPEICERALEGTLDVSVVLAGDGAIEQLKELLEGKRIETAVSFPGWVRGGEKERLLRESSVFLFPSYHEGMPMAVLEAMAYGMAIVTTKVGGIPKLIEHGVSGYLHEPGDILGMAQSMRELLMDDDRRRKMGMAARDKAVRCYSMEGHVKKLLSLYEKVLSGNKA